MQRQQEPTIKTKSAALLAAEAAFAPPRQTTEQLFATGSPTITVLRGKGSAALAGLTETSPRAVTEANITSDAQIPTPKVPRTFLLKPAHGELGSRSSESWPLPEGSAEEAGALPGRGGTASTPLRRVKRSRNKPPPVTLVFAATAAAGKDTARGSGGEAPASSAHAQRDMSVHRMAALTAALAEIEPIFAVIGSAMSFRIEAPAIAAQWERLSRALDELAAEIRAASGKAPAGQNDLVKPMPGGRRELAEFCCGVSIAIGNR